MSKNRKVDFIKDSRSFDLRRSHVPPQLDKNLEKPSAFFTPTSTMNWHRTRKRKNNSESEAQLLKSICLRSMISGLFELKAQTDMGDSSRHQLGCLRQTGAPRNCTDMGDDLCDPRLIIISAILLVTEPEVCLKRAPPAQSEQKEFGSKVKAASVLFGHFPNNEDLKNLAYVEKCVLLFCMFDNLSMWKHDIY